MIEKIGRLFGRQPRTPLADDVKQAMRDRDTAFQDLDDAITEVDRLKNGVIRDYETAERILERERRRKRP